MFWWISFGGLILVWILVGLYLKQQAGFSAKRVEVYCPSRRLGRSRQQWRFYRSRERSRQRYTWWEENRFVVLVAICLIWIFIHVSVLWWTMKI